VEDAGSRSHCGLEEAPHRRAVRGLEGDVGLPEPVTGGLDADPELGMVRGPVADDVAELGAPAASQRCEDRS